MKSLILNTFLLIAGAYHQLSNSRHSFAQQTKSNPKVGVRQTSAYMTRNILSSTFQHRCTIEGCIFAYLVWSKQQNLFIYMDSVLQSFKDFMMDYVFDEHVLCSIDLYLNLFLKVISCT